MARVMPEWELSACLFQEFNRIKGSRAKFAVPHRLSAVIIQVEDRKKFPRAGLDGEDCPFDSTPSTAIRGGLDPGGLRGRYPCSGGELPAPGALLHSMKGRSPEVVSIDREAPTVDA